jgi:UDP-GlcNAc3NAcA epimerase
LSDEEWLAFNNHRYVNVLEPVSYTDMIALEQNCDLVITDSGGVQKEAYFFQKPCMILRPETEWVEIINQGVAFLADVNFEDFIQKYHLLESKKITYPKLFGDGNSAEFICSKIVRTLV